MNPILTKAYLAGGTVRARRVVKFSASGTVVECTAAADLAIGVSRGNQSDTLVGDRVDVQQMGIADCICGAAVVRGNMVSSDANGAIIPWVTPAVVLGQALESAAAGDLFPVQLQ